MLGESLTKLLTITQRIATALERIADSLEDVDKRLSTNINFQTPEEIEQTNKRMKKPMCMSQPMNLTPF